jgi:uncharacterized protein (TIGR03089 family)
MTPEQLFNDLMAAQPSRPFITYYDEATGERTELSVRSSANWVAKTHHLLATELGLGVGDTALVALPAHWISVPVLLGCLTAGLSVGADVAEAAVAFVTPGASASSSLAADVYAISPDRAAAGFGDEPPPGTLDYVSAVRPQADAWGTVRLTAGPSDPFSAALTRGAAVEQASSRADGLGWQPGARVLSTRPWRGVDDWIDTLLAPLAVGGSMVYVVGTDDVTVLDRRADQERCSARL